MDIDLLINGSADNRLLCRSIKSVLRIALRMSKVRNVRFIQ
jgi:hypothetical protein